MWVGICLISSRQSASRAGKPLDRAERHGGIDSRATVKSQGYQGSQQGPGEGTRNILCAMMQQGESGKKAYMLGHGLVA